MSDREMMVDPRFDAFFKQEQIDDYKYDGESILMGNEWKIWKEHGKTPWNDFQKTYEKNWVTVPSKVCISLGVCRFSSYSNPRNLNLLIFAELRAILAQIQRKMPYQKFSTYSNPILQPTSLRQLLEAFPTILWAADWFVMSVVTWHSGNITVSTLAMAARDFSEEGEHFQQILMENLKSAGFFTSGTLFLVL